MKKNLFYSILLSVVNILFPVLSFPYASHILGPAGIGKVQFIVSFSQYFALFAALGIPIYGVKETAKYRDDPEKLNKVFTELSTIFFITSLLLFSLYLWIIYSFSFFSTDRALYIYAGILILLSFTYTDWFYSGIEEFKGITIRSVLIKSISLLLLYIFIKTESDFRNYLGIIIFSIIGNQVLSFVLVFRKTKLSFHQLNLKRHWVPLFYIFGATMAASVYTVLDTVILGFLSNNQAVGLYTAAVKLIKITIPIITSMGLILIPSISKHFAENRIDKMKELLSTSFNFLIFLSIPTCLGLAILAQEFLIVFSGQSFIKATTSMQILSVLPILIGFGHFFCFQVLMPSGKNKEIFLSMLAGVFTCLILNMILVPSMQEVGASIANIITELVASLSYLYFIRKYFSINYDLKIVLQSILSSLLFIPLIFSIRYLHLSATLTLTLSVIVCMASYLSFQLYIFKNILLFNFITILLNKFSINKQVEND